MRELVQGDGTRVVCGSYTGCEDTWHTRHIHGMYMAYTGCVRRGRRPSVCSGHRERGEALRMTLASLSGRRGAHKVLSTQAAHLGRCERTPASTEAKSASMASRSRSPPLPRPSTFMACRISFLEMRPSPLTSHSPKSCVMRRNQKQSEVIRSNQKQSCGDSPKSCVAGGRSPQETVPRSSVELRPPCDHQWPFADTGAGSAHSGHQGTKSRQGGRFGGHAPTHLRDFAPALLVSSNQ